MPGPRAQLAGGGRSWPLLGRGACSSGSLYLPAGGGYAQVGPGVVPRIVGAVMILSSASMLLREALTGGFRGVDEEAEAQAARWTGRRSRGSPAASSLYGLLVERARLPHRVGARSSSCVARGFGSRRWVLNAVVGLASRLRSSSRSSTTGSACTLPPASLAPDPSLMDIWAQPAAGLRGRADRCRTSCGASSACTLGTAVGVLPGIGPAVTVALLLPITTKVDASGALIMFAGIYYGAMYGGSTTSILLNTPGESATIVTAMEGNQMAQARGARARRSPPAPSARSSPGRIATIGLTFLSPLVVELGAQVRAAGILRADDRSPSPPCPRCWANRRCAAW